MQPTVRAGNHMGNSLNQGPFLNPQYSTAPLFKKDPKRDPNLENCPYWLRSTEAHDLETLNCLSPTFETNSLNLKIPEPY